MIRLSTLLLARGFKEVNPLRKDKGPTENTWFNREKKIKVRRDIIGPGQRKILVTSGGKVLKEFILPKQENEARSYIVENF